MRNHSAEIVRMPKLCSKCAGLITIAVVLISGCGARLGPAYDAAQDDPANRLPEQIVVHQRDTAPTDQNKAAQQLVEENRAEYEAWLEARNSGSDEYQEFLEYKEWLEFKKKQDASI